MSDSNHHLGDTALFDRLSRFWDRLAPAPDVAELRAGLDLADREIDRVVDLAGGTGRAVRSLPLADRLVVDAAPGMVRQAHDSGTTAVLGDAATLPLRDDAVDAALVLDALHHVGDPDAALAEAARVIRPGGVLVVREFDPTTFRGRLLVAAEHLFGFDSTFFAPDELARMAAEAGFDARFRGGFEYTLVGKVPSE